LFSFKIYIYYENFNELREILEKYANKHSSYLNAQKFLFDFKLKHFNELDMSLIQLIGQLSPIDSYVLKYCDKFNDSVVVIDCLFEMLDGSQWKYDYDCWSIFNNTLLKCGKK
jgi:hypothetical protein